MEAWNSLEKYLSAVRYRWRWVASIGAAVALSMALVVWLMPNQYSATTTILVDPQKVPDRYVTTTITEDPNERLNNLTQEVLSRTRLSEIVDKYDLYPKLREKEGRDRVIAFMRTEIQIQVKKTSGAALSAFTITYRSHDRNEVARVTNQLAESFTDWNLEQRQTLVEGTTRFLNDELGQARTGLEQQEERVRDYRLAHLGEMPEQMQANLGTLQRLQAQLAANGESLNRLDQERLTLLQDPGTAAGLTTSSGVSLSPRARLHAQLAEARKQVEDLSARYTPQHPDLLAARERVQDLTAQLQQMPEDSSGAVAAASGSEVGARLKLLDTQKAQLLAQGDQLQSQIRHYQHLVDAVPVREAEVSGLMRDYESAKENYHSLLEKSYSAEMATELERKQQGERFQILDPAVTPDHADSPNRPLLWFASLLLGIAAGVGAAILLDTIDGSIKTEAELRALLPQDAILLGHIPALKGVPPRRTRISAPPPPLAGTPSLGAS